MKKIIVGMFIVCMITVLACEQKPDTVEKKDIAKEEPTTKKEAATTTISNVPPQQEKAPAVVADLPTVAPDVVTIDNPGYKKDTKGPVLFDHKKHSEEYISIATDKISCTECHHVYQDDKNTWKEGDPVHRCASAECHDPLKKVGERRKLQLAYHTNCKDCHTALIKAKKKSADEAPTSCNKCMHS